MSRVDEECFQPDETDAACECDAGGRGRHPVSGSRSRLPSVQAALSHSRVGTALPGLGQMSIVSLSNLRLRPRGGIACGQLTRLGYKQGGHAYPPENT
jgi:hypothetical protein